MPIACRHSWNVSMPEAIRLQETLKRKVIRRDGFGRIRTVAGVDASFAGGRARAAAVLLSFPALATLEIRTAERAVSFPYVPGLLAFREIPAVLAALSKLKRGPDLLMADAQGVAHPRRLGLASHLGVILDIPSIGCAKSRLVGRHAEPGSERGDWTALVDRGERVGAVLRTKVGSRPLYVSTGHRVSLAAAVRIVLACLRGYRLPEPTRLADRAAGFLAIVGAPDGPRVQLQNPRGGNQRRAR